MLVAALAIDVVAVVAVEVAVVAAAVNEDCKPIASNAGATVFAISAAKAAPGIV